MLTVRNSNSPSISSSDTLLISPSISISATITSTSNPEQNTVAKQLVEEFLSKYLLDTYPINEQILDFEVISAEVSKRKTGVIITTVYSVKPVSNESIWHMTSGALTSDGWVRNKGGCSVVKKLIITPQDHLAGIGSGCAVE